MKIRDLSPNQTDMLQEIVNIAMGQAADSLARVFDCFVRLSVPRIALIEATRIRDSMAALVKDDTLITAVRQSFCDDLSGEAIALFRADSFRGLSALMDFPDLEPQSEKEQLLDISNILVGACLNGIAEQLSANLSFSPPSLIAQNTTARELLTPSSLPWDYALQVEVNFSLENRDFMSHVIIMMPQDAVGSLQHSLEQFLESVA